MTTKENQRKKKKKRMLMLPEKFIWQPMLLASVGHPVDVIEPLPKKEVKAYRHNGVATLRDLSSGMWMFMILCLFGIMRVGAPNNPIIALRIYMDSMMNLTCRKIAEIRNVSRCFVSRRNIEFGEYRLVVFKAMETVLNRLNRGPDYFSDIAILSCEIMAQYLGEYELDSTRAKFNGLLMDLMKYTNEELDIHVSCQIKRALNCFDVEPSGFDERPHYQKMCTFTALVLVESVNICFSETVSGEIGIDDEIIYVPLSEICKDDDESEN